MRRVLVPLDGTALAPTILPDARRLAGPGGELILVRDAGEIRYDRATGSYTDRVSNRLADEYLEAHAAALEEDGVRVSVERLVTHEIALAINGAARLFQADMIACATHGRGPLGRLIRGGIAWKALAHSPVPVLLRHPAENWKSGLRPIEPRHRTVLVPLDGSSFAERALPLARELMREWGATVWLVQVVPDMPIPDTRSTRGDMVPDRWTQDPCGVRSYLDRIAHGLSIDVLTQVVLGSSVVHTLMDVVEARSITDIVMASHGRTGLSRVMLGSVADELIQRLHCPIIVIPAFAAHAAKMEGSIPGEERTGVMQ